MVKCQICGFEHSDPCEFIMWQRTNFDDKPIEDYLISCKNKKCQDWIDKHDELFIEVPWGQGGPGRFMLLCGPCSFRDKWRCTHPDLKANGGPGLKVEFGRGYVISYCEEGKWHHDLGAATSCAGRKE